MRSLRQCVVLLAVLLSPHLAMPLLAQAAVAQAPLDCEREKVLEDYLRHRDPKVKLGTYVLAFDHASEDWFLTRWQNSVVGDPKSPPKLVDLTAELTLDRKPVVPLPRVSLRKDNRLLVVVVDTNPMLFAANRGATTEVDIESIAELEQLARLLGGVVSDALRVSNFRPVAVGQPAPAVAAVTLLNRSAAEIDARVSGEEWKKLLSSELTVIYIDLANAIEAKTKTWAAALATFGNARQVLANSIESLDEATHSGRAYLRAIENQRLPNQHLADIAFLTDGDEQLDDGAIALARARNSLPMPTCIKTFTAASAAVARKLQGFSKDGKAAEEVALARNLAALSAQEMTDDQCEGAEQGPLLRLAGWLRRNPAQVTPALQVDQSGLISIQSTCDQYLALAERVGTTRSTAAELLAKIPAAGKAAEALRAFRDREDDHFGSTDPTSQLSRDCRLVAGVLEVVESTPEVGALKLQKSEFALAEDAPLASDIAQRNHRAFEKVPYEVASTRASDFSLGFGVIRIDTVSPSWKAVTDPRVAAPDDKTPKVIARSDEESRSGDAALLFTWSPRQPERFFRWGIDVGAKLDTNHPGALVGISTSLGRFARLGAGASWIRVKTLGGGQHELGLLPDGSVDPKSITVVSSNDDIRLRDDFDPAWYVSLSFTLDALPFFRPEEEE